MTSDTSIPETLGRYEILSELGKGAMGIVYLGRDPLIGRQLALKTFRLGYSAGDQELEQFRERFLREAQSAGILSHPNIVTIHDVAVDPGGDFFIAMEFVKGTDLKLVMQRQGRFEPSFAFEVVAQIADGLDYAHSNGVVHRDIKPANIIITADKQAKITDFGIARVEASNLTMEGQLLGTPNYMAPEQIQGLEVDHRADIFSLGVMLYELITGKKPFAAPNLSAVTHRIVTQPFPPLEQHVPDLPPAITQVLDRALAKDPAERYNRGADMAADLRAIFAPPTAAVPASRGSSFLDAPEPSATATTAPATGPPAAPPTGAVPVRQAPAAGLPAATPQATGTGTVPAVAAPAAAGTPRQAPDSSLAPRDGMPVAGRVAAAVGLVIALAVAGFGIFKLIAGGREVPPEESVSLSEDSELPRLVEEGRQLLEAGDAVAALELFDQALVIAPEDPEARRWRDQAEGRVSQPDNDAGAEAAGRLKAAREALRARDYPTAIELAEKLLEADPEHQEGQSLLAEAREGHRRRQEIRDRLRNRPQDSAPQPTPGRPPAPPPVAAPKPAVAPVAKATLVVDFSSRISAGRLTIFNGKEEIYKNQVSGNRRANLSLSSGNLDLRIYLYRKDAQARSRTRDAAIKGNLPPGGTRVLKIEVSDEGFLSVALE